MGMLLNDSKTSGSIMSPQSSPIVVDVAIVGAGIAGLWLANLLANRGLSIALCDGNPVGGAQTTASQGIVHSGVKYALTGGVGANAGPLAGMPARWRACLAGNGEVDLRGVTVPAEHMHLFGSDANARALRADRALAGEVKRADAAAAARFGQRALFALADFVVDVPALVRHLAEPLRHRLLAAQVDADAVALGPTGVAQIQIGGRGLRAGAYVFAAGAGNAAFARRINANGAAMRRRPLRQTRVRLRGSAPQVFAHCLGATLGAQPELTITSHGNAFHVGGAIADDGAARGAAEHVAAVRAALGEHLPGVDWTGAAFDTLLVDRAEPAAGALGDTADAFVFRHGNCLICWPVKLSLAPRLGDKVLAELADLQPTATAWPGNADVDLRYAAAPWTASGAGALGRCRRRKRVPC